MEDNSTAVPAGQKQAPPVPTTRFSLLHTKTLHVSIFYTDTGLRPCLEIIQDFQHRLHQQNIFGSFQTLEIQLGINISKDKKTQKIQAKLKIQILFSFLRVIETNCFISLIFCCFLSYLHTLETHEKKQWTDQKFGSFLQLSKLR